MKTMHLFIVITSSLTMFASAELIRGVDIDFVTIGNENNPADTTGFGSVGYTYKIGTYEITNAQWNTFISQAGAPTGNLTSIGDNAYDENPDYTGDLQPTTRISWLEAAQLCNYLTSGDKSKGVYQFTGNNTNPGDFVRTNRNAARAAYGKIYFIPTRNEWYKAAYYKPDASGYSLYANGTSSAPQAGVDSNYDGVVGTPWNIGDGTIEQNGTYDMMGNAWEWTQDRPIYDAESSYIRGGCFIRYGGSIGPGISSTEEEILAYKSAEGRSIGFRIAAIPEPATSGLLALGMIALLRKRS